MHNESSTPYRLRILHISDLHERGPRESESWRRRCVLGAAWENNLRQLLDDGPVDLVCFTGDAADWGLAEEYEAATRHFVQLLERIQLSPERLFLVPGNHDVHRETQRNTWLALHKALARDLDGLALSRWMAGDNNDSGRLRLTDNQIMRHATDADGWPVMWIWCYAGIFTRPKFTLGLTPIDKSGSSRLVACTKVIAPTTTRTPVY